MYWIRKEQNITDLWVSIDRWHYYLPQRVYFNFIRALFETRTKLGGRRVFCTGLEYDSVARWVRRRHYIGEAHDQRCRWGKQIIERENFWQHLFLSLTSTIPRQLGLPDNSSLARLIETTGWHDSPTFACSSLIACSRERPNHWMKAGLGTNSQTQPISLDCIDSVGCPQPLKYSSAINLFCNSVCFPSLLISGSNPRGIFQIGWRW